MEVRTHAGIDPTLCGEPVELGDGRARVRLRASQEMAVDDRALVHGGFVFGLADHAAMLAVNEPTVVLGSSRSKFLRPISVGDTMVATATTTVVDGRRHEVDVEVSVGTAAVFRGTFDCFVLDRHVLDSA